MGADREHWVGNNDPYVGRSHRALVGELSTFFAQETPSRLAYDGKFWTVKAGVVRGAQNPSYEEAHMVVRRSESETTESLYRVDISHPLVNPYYFEYSELGGFYISETGVRGNPVYEGQYLAMKDMLNSTDPNEMMTIARANEITNKYLTEMGSFAGPLALGGEGEPPLVA